ncbi:hypothetical protein DPMN_169410 [Dreissena polymorpha]|uniref:Uncharacterized protein n=1 Tax=Dreissena polymorpha TaxID=45954 RepID=A0A9D4IDK7_DREPO|nr:hypothetical protein DPMN_169410 [Dreissena polymorpha]
MQRVKPHSLKQFVDPIILVGGRAVPQTGPSWYVLWVANVVHLGAELWGVVVVILHSDLDVGLVPVGRIVVLYIHCQVEPAHTFVVHFLAARNRAPLVNYRV